ncbi:hypothetical protein F7725_014754 [Dissostichus mawsoni]|uniref:PH domain-containing protein n=1 Tax=Dissostichus mawsoni TaxID=36200 RepID=A0A7J5YXB2_DISMA|nr:hypothetical protein F7725_014754 [Dissostichus mawsoni]
MSTAKENPCRKFQANFFNKTKLLFFSPPSLLQAKPIYGGWLCLAPEGTDFDNPMQRSRKWQRRFFVLYEHGCLRFALDESGTVNMNICVDVIDAEPKTGQKNSLCIMTPDQEYFIRGENKEIINGWSEQLVVYPRTNKQNQKKKRKVEPTTSQEPGPAKVAVTGSGIPEAEKVPDSSSIIWQEELNQREAEGASVWAPADLPPGGSDVSSVNGDEVDRGSLALHGSAPQPPRDLLSPTGSCSSLGGIPRCLSPAPSDPFPSGSSLLSNGSHISGSVSSLDSDTSGSTVTSNESHPAHQRGGHAFSHHDTPRARRLEAEARKAEKRSRYRSPERQERDAVLSPERSRSGVIEKLEALELENQEKMEVEESGGSGSRQGRSEQRRFQRGEQRRDVGSDFPSALPPLRRAKSLDRRTTESVMTPDLLNFKKGWMVKLDEQGQWKKYWFVLTDHSLRYYKDSIAEETKEGVQTLSAMTAGIRRNWIQAVMKNVRPSTAPDVASSTEDHGSFSPLEGLVRPDVTQDSPSSEASIERESTAGVIKSRARERRREGRSKTFDWAEFRPIAQALAQQRAQEAESLHADLELERSRRKEERRKRYDSVTNSAPEQTLVKAGGRTDCESAEGVGQTDPLGPVSLERQQMVEEVIEQHWQQVEKTPIREERRVTLPPPVQSRDTAELEQLLENYKQGIEGLKAQLEGCHQQLLDSSKHKQELELQLRTALDREHDIRAGYISPLEHPLGLEADVTPQTKRPELKNELLTSENGALKQRCQEIVNQLTEADREIDRLKVELISQQGGKQHHLVMEELKILKAELAENQANSIDREFYERELNEKSLRLHEALITMEELGNTLKETEKKLQLKEATLKGLGFNPDYEEEEEEEEELHPEEELLESSQAKLFEMEANLHSKEKRCLELEARNRELMTLNQESEKLSREMLREAENKITMLREKLELKTARVEKTISECVEAGKTQVLEMLAKVDVDVENTLNDLKSTLFSCSKEEQPCVSQKDMRLLIEGEFWSQLLGSSIIKPEEDRRSFDRGLARQMLAQKRLMLLIRRICPQEKDESEVVTEPDFASMYKWLNNETNALIKKELKDTLEEKSSVLKQIVSSVKLAKDDQILSLAITSFVQEQKPSSDHLFDALKEAYMSYVITRLKVQHKQELKQKQTEVENGSLDCPNCHKLKEATKNLELKLAFIQSQLATGQHTFIQMEGEPTDSLHQSNELHARKELQEVKDSYEKEAEKLRHKIAKADEMLRIRSEENVKEINSLTNCMESLKEKHEMERTNLMERFDREMEELRSMMSPSNQDKNSADTDRPPHLASAHTSTLKERIRELVTQVSVMTQEMRRREEQGENTTLRLKYEKDLENLKATCERGFAAMEDSHQKVIDELQKKNHRELENLHAEKERLLEEETAATIAAIEAMKNAHRSELEKELDKARKANSNTENADIEEIRRQHEEELCSFQREIEVLSEQYSQKCLENAHLAQALEAERQALRQCQRENQELNAHNQELNNRLAAEITKMRSMTSEDGVMLRVKESEVQYLKQEINSLKDELQSAQRDKKYATDKYKDIYTELSIVKAKAERDLGRLRDQLQLAHQALGEASLEEVERGGYVDIMKSKSNPDILKMAAAAAKRSERTLRSKSLREGLTAEQRLHLFENKDAKEF